MIIKQPRIIKAKIYNVAMAQVNPATEETLANILTQLDTALSTRASQATLASILTQLDVALSTRGSEATLATLATQTTLASVLTKLDVALSTRLADATFTGRVGEIQASPTANTILERLKQVQDRIGEISATPTTYTVQERLKNIETRLLSFLDGTLWQRLVEAGYAFQVTSNLITITGIAEVNFILLKNPSGSGKRVRLQELIFDIGLAGGAQSLKSTFRVYRNATVTTNGTALTIYKTKPDGATNTIMEAYTSPTTSSRGTFVNVFPFTQGVFNRTLDLTRYILDGSNLLITAEPATTNTEHAFSSAWAEV